MKKIMLMAAFAGLLAGNAVASGKGGDDKDKGKKECKKDGKSCAGEKKCCKKDAKAEDKASDKAAQPAKKK